MNRKSLFVSLLVLMVLLVAFGAFANAPRIVNQPGINAAAESPFAPDRVLVQIRSSSMNQTVSSLQPRVPSPNLATGISSFDAVSAQVGAVSIAKMFMQPADAVEAARLGIDRWVMVKLAPGSDVQAAVAAYAGDPSVENATPDWRAYFAAVPTDPAYPQHWGHNNTAQLPDLDWGGTYDHTLGTTVGTPGFDANAELGWNGTAGFGSASVIIAIIDSGVNLSHPDLTLVAGYDFGDSDATPEDDSSAPGHGTACAGVAAARANNALGACGSAPGCSVMPLKVVDTAGNLFFSYVAPAITYAADNGAAVISMSFGNPSLTTHAATDAAVLYAAGKGVTMLAATDNDNASTISYPANLASVIGVGAASPCDGRKRSSSNAAECNPGVNTDPNGYTCDGERWWGSSYGPNTQDAAGAVDVIAPTILYTTDIQGAGGYKPGDYDPYFNGTSCATPYTAGVCALIKSKNPGWTPAQVRAQLTSTAQDVVNVESGAGWDRYSGYGLVDINAAVGCGADPVALVKNFSADANTDCCITVNVSDIDNGSYDPDGAGDIASLCITQVDGSPVACLQSVEVCGDGNHTVRLTITDNCGYTDYADATVEVVNSPPVAIAQDFWANADDNCCIVVNLDDVDGGSYDPDGAGDIKSFCITGLDGSPVACKQTIDVCGEGFHTVDITITDWCDSTRTATANVEVIDITPPSIDVVLNRDALWPPNHKMVEVCTSSVEVEDNCDPDPDVVLVSIESSEPDNDKGDGNTVNDIQNAATGTEDYCFDLRSERQGGGNGRKYTIIYSATDNAGNVGYDTVCVRVPHDQSGHAMSAMGFVPDGTALEFGANTFALLIPGSSSLDVSKIDVNNIYVGNTRDAVKANRTKQMDFTGDGIQDLAALYESLSPSEMAATVQVLDDGGDGEQIEKNAQSDGPIGLHYVSKGVDYLVSDIYSLSWVDISGMLVDDVPTDLPPPGGAGSESLTSDRVATGFTSIHPNPFNPQTTVDFALATSERVRIAIYDVRGSLVTRLVDETMPAGQHQARWNGVDNKGMPAASGIYFVRMIAGSYSEVRKIVMLK